MVGIYTSRKGVKGSGIELYKMGIPGFPTYIEWLKDNLRKRYLGLNGDISTSDVER